MELSKYQKEIIDFFKNNPHDNVIVKALAGTGKSTLICLLTEETSTSDIYVAFNSSIAEEFSRKINNPKTKVKTLHSLGLAIMNSNLSESSSKGGIGSRNSSSGGATLDNFKIHKIIDELIYETFGKYDKFEHKIFIKDNYVQLYNLCRLTCTNMSSESEVEKLVKDYNLFVDYSGNDFSSPLVSTMVEWLEEIDEKSIEEFKTSRVIDFTDMLYITYKKLSSGEWKVPYYNYYTNIYIDECLPGDVYIQTEKNPVKIKTLYNKYKVGKDLPLVKSFNEKTNEYEFKPILNVAKHENREVFEIKTEGLNKIRATSNHRFLTQRGYVYVKDLKIGEDCLILDTPNNQKTKFMLNEDQLQLVLASSIGDGHLTKMSDYNTYRLSFTQGDSQYNYFNFKKKMMNCSFERKIKSGYTEKISINQTSSKIFVLPHSPWELINKIDERFLAIWFQDDGSSFYHDYVSGRNVSHIRIACNNLTLEQCELLRNIINEKFKINFIISTDKEKYCSLRLNVDDSHRFLRLIAPFMNEDCAYKNPYFDKNNLYNWNCNFLPYGANYIKSIQKCGVEDVYDIEVKDNHNFICKNGDLTKNTGIISHNCQDLSTIQLKLLKFIKRSKGRYIFVGDFNQACYNFCGSNARSFTLIPKLYAPIKEFDLPINYRCPTSHLAKVNRDFGIPIQPRPDAPIGSIKTIDKEEIKKYVHAGDLVISRKNKWLSDVILDLAIHGIPIYMEDKDMVEQIKKLVSSQKAASLYELKNKLEKIIKKYNVQLEKIVKKETEKAEEDTKKMIDVSDTNSRIDNINFIKSILSYYSSQPQNKYDKPDDFIRYIDVLLNTKMPSNCVRVCSVHKAKGLEAPQTFVLNEAKVCTDRRNSWEQNEQEKNLSYISITRAKENLFLVRETDV